MLDVAVPNGATSMQLRARRILYTCSPPRRRAARAHAPASPAPVVAPASWLSPPRAPPLGALLADERLSLKLDRRNIEIARSNYAMLMLRVATLRRT